MQIAEQSEFTETLWEYYRQHGRSLPWREIASDGQINPYHVLVSEIMLQQTRVNRVISKYAEFLERFPSVKVLACAELGDVLKVWSGLGYNRRAKFLWQAAQELAKLPAFPDTLDGLIKLPGVGRNTAAAVLTYAFNQPHVFIETNVRTVYIHHFFVDAEQVGDAELLPIIEATVDREHSREFYWALMDYGTFIKSSIGNKGRQSKHYTKQSAFEGSLRQVRGRILKGLIGGPQTLTGLQKDMPTRSSRNTRKRRLDYTIST